MSIDKRLISTGPPPVCTADTLDIFGDSSCIALYGLNYDGSDAGGNYNGTSTDVTFNAPGYIDYAASFNGSSSNITPSGLTSAQFGSNGEMSISWWMNTPINDTTIAFICEGDTDSEYMVHLGGSNTRGMRIAFRAATTNVLDVANAFTANTWQHFVAVMTPTGNKLYRDGSLVGSNTFSEAATSFSTFYIGSRRNSQYRFEGKLDQVRIFNKELSAAEVTTLYGEVACEYTCTTDTNGFPASASSDLVAYYKLDNDATDETGSYNGTASNVTFDGGRYGASAVFNGSSSQIDITATATTPVDFSSRNYSISAWIQSTHTSAGIIYSKYGDTNTARSFSFLLNASGNVFMYEVGSGGDNSTTTSTSVNDGNWHHVVVTKSSTATTIYIDGSLDTQNSNTFTSYDAGTETIHIGRDDTTPDWFKGKIDQVRIYNSALSSTEVTSLYEDEHQCYITVDSTDPFVDSSNIALYEFENNANDSNGSYNGTASNITYSTDSIIGTYAASFNGSNGYISTPLNTSNIVSNINSRTQDFTFSCWIYSSTVSGNGDIMYLGNYTTYVPNYHWIGIARNSGNVKFEAYNGTAYNVSTSISADTWYHLVAVRDNSVLKFYVDGSLIGSTTQAGDTSISASSVLRIGANINPTTYFQGKIDQVRVFDRALNGDEVWKLYAEGAKG